MGLFNLVAFWVSAVFWAKAMDERKPGLASWHTVMALVNFAFYVEWTLRL